MTDETATLPSDFIVHDGGECPVDAQDAVEVIIRTAEGFGSNVCRAKFHEWRSDRHEGGIGAVVAYRPVVNTRAEPHFHNDARFHIDGID